MHQMIGTAAATVAAPPPPSGNDACHQPAAGASPAPVPAPAPVPTAVPAESRSSHVAKPCCLAPETVIVVVLLIVTAVGAMMVHDVKHYKVLVDKIHAWTDAAHTRSALPWYGGGGAGVLNTTTLGVAPRPQAPSAEALLCSEARAARARPDSRAYGANSLLVARASNVTALTTRRHPRQERGRAPYLLFGTFKPLHVGVQVNHRAAARSHERTFYNWAHLGNECVEIIPHDCCLPRWRHAARFRGVRASFTRV